jgi:hypothetical protein
MLAVRLLVGLGILGRRDGGSLSLIAAMPITTLLAGSLTCRKWM